MVNKKDDYHFTTFLHARQAEDDSDQDVESNRQNRNKNTKKIHAIKRIIKT